MKKTIKRGSALFFGVIGLSLLFQNCADNGFQTETFSSFQSVDHVVIGETQNINVGPNQSSDLESPQIPQPTSGTAGGGGGVPSSNDLLDLAEFFSSSKIPQKYSTSVMFTDLHKFSDNSVLLNTKYNQKDNFEIFLITSDMILIRYETAPKIFGEGSNSTNAVRRFTGLPVKSADLKGATALPAKGNLGAPWMKRFVSRSDQNKRYVGSQAIDHYNYSGAISRSTDSVAYLPMYFWFDFKNSNQRYSFMPSTSSFGEILRISQQWSRCNIEQYEYARGVGLIAWRSLLSETCLTSLSGYHESEVHPNYYGNLAHERFFVDQGANLKGEFFSEVYNGRVSHSYRPGGIFIEDYPYHFTVANEMIVSSLRSTGPSVQTQTCDSLLATKVTNTTSTEIKIRMSYCLVLKRPVDSSALAEAQKNKVSIKSLLKSLFLSKEFSTNVLSGRSVYSVSNSAFLDSIYGHILNRSSDVAGKSFWLNLLNEGKVTRDQILDNFLMSTEFEQRFGSLLK